ncbi:hypothetical protein FCL40_09120 [Ferrimonas sediminicola]|uniref:Uncharacterized protein n=1 Tax=Ferrimonas sediminicola TaxID=2569538 RepID=A0A4U1BE99_9GAMM|nr:hypothetical protein [Ferrimonas sediminicola]TKB49473.1 hypothetical protein FCL40_09120 [Ferrimonas sediminicola]
MTTIRIGLALVKMAGLSDLNLGVDAGIKKASTEAGFSEDGWATRIRTWGSMPGSKKPARRLALVKMAGLSDLNLGVDAGIKKASTEAGFSEDGWAVGFEPGGRCRDQKSQHGGWL